MCPPGVDQTQRGRQYYMLIAPILKQHYDPKQIMSTSSKAISWARDDKGILPLFFNGDSGWDVWNLLGTPSPNYQQVSQAPVIKRRAPCPLERLPIEILTQILREVAISFEEYGDEGSEDPRDLMALGLCSTLLFDLVLGHLLQRDVRRAPWKDTPIALQGNYSNTLPPPFQTYANENVGHPVKMAQSRRLFYKTVHNDCSAISRKQIRDYMIAANKWRESSGLTAERWSKIEHLLSNNNFYPKTRDWLLRNLTTREFISHQTLTKNEDNEEAPIQIEDVLLQRIVWTSMPGCASTGLDFGIWAGHCFDIVTRKIHDAEDKGDWRDVSDEALEEARTLRQKVLTIRKQAEENEIRRQQRQRAWDKLKAKAT